MTWPKPYAMVRDSSPPYLRNFVLEAFRIHMTEEEWGVAWNKRYYDQAPWPDVTEEMYATALRLHEEWCWEHAEYKKKKMEEQAKLNAELASCGITTGRKFGTDVADFYLLEWLDHIGMPGASQMLVDLETTLAADYSGYLFVALGGESRYGRGAKNEWGVHVPKSIKEWCDHSDGMEREQAWFEWIDYTYKMTDSERNEKIRGIRDLMFDESWGGGDNPSAGGAMWGTCARVLLDYYEGRLKRRNFVDRCFTLEHNNGCVFNKMYDVRTAMIALNLQTQSKYDSLAQLASDEVAALWADYRQRQRQEFDPAWLGVQHV